MDAMTQIRLMVLAGFIVLFVVTVGAALLFTWWLEHRREKPAESTPGASHRVREAPSRLILESADCDLTAPVSSKAGCCG